MGAGYLYHWSKTKILIFKVKNIHTILIDSFNTSHTGKIIRKLYNYIFEKEFTFPLPFLASLLINFTPVCISIAEQSTLVCIRTFSHSLKTPHSKIEKKPIVVAQTFLGGWQEYIREKKEKKKRALKECVSILYRSLKFLSSSYYYSLLLLAIKFSSFYLNEPSRIL